MRGTHIFRKAIREAMLMHGVTFKHSYTDRVKGDYWDSRRRRICFYECQLKGGPQVFEAFGRRVAEADGNMTAIWMATDGTIFFNIRALVN